MIDRLAAYVAADRLHALAEGRDLPDRTTGSALSADLAGFTRFTNALAQRLGPRQGPEELTRQLNAVYDGLVAEVGEAGGSVVGFAGDGLTAWFDDDRGPAAPRAVACGLSLQRRFSEWAAAEEGRSALALRVAVATGPVRRFAVGDPAVHRLDALAGETMTRLAAADAVARSGEVVVDEATATGAGSVLEAGEGRPDVAGRHVLAVRRLAGTVPAVPWPDRRARLTPEALRPWVLPAVFERLRAGQADFMTELRPVGALFLGFDGIDYDSDPGAGAALDAFVRRVQAMLARYEGSLLQVTIGDKGSYLYACFGAPVAHEDDALRSVRAALRLSRIADSPARSVRIGVSHGTARVGAYGGERRRTYGALGDEVNLAARLMQKAPAGEPLFSARVRQATEDEVSWDSLEPVLVKGHAEPVPVFRAVGATAPASPRAIPLAGREDERTALAWAVEAVASGEGTVLLLEGEAGLGKSRLLEELVERAEASGARVLAGAGDGVERHQPYHGWRPVFEQLLDLGSQGGRYGRRAVSATIALGRTQARLASGAAGRRPDLAEEDAARVRARVAAAARGFDGLAPLLNAVLARGLPETARTNALAPVARAGRTLELLVGLLRRAAEESPLLVVLEDAHCLDSASWALALRAAGTKGLCLAVAARPLGRDAPPELELLRRRDRTWAVPVGPLCGDAIDAIAAGALGAAGLARPLAAAIRARAEGSPLVALEVVRALQDEALVEVVDEEARLASAAATEALALSGTVEGLVLGRIDRLSPVAQRVLKVGAVIGRSFGWSALSQVLRQVGGGEPPRELPPALRQLEQAGLVEALRDASEPAWSFRSALVQDVVYNLMTSDQRRELHRALAERLEGASGTAESTELAVLAHHWVRAGRMLRAQPYLERAAEATLRAGAWAEAARLYGMLVRSDEVLPSDPAGRLRQARWRSQLGAAEAGAGRLGEAGKQVEAALGLLGQSSGGSLVRAALAAGARDAVRRVAPGLARARVDAPLAEAARAYERLAELHYLSGAPVDAFREALRGLELALLTGQDGVRTRLQATVSLFLSVAPARRLAGPLIADAVAGARAAGEPDTLVWVLQLAALQAFALGHWSETAEKLDEALSLSEGTGDRRRALELRTLRAWALLTRGDLRAAGPFLAALERDAEAEGDQRSRAAAGTGLALVALRNGEVATTMALVRGRRAPALLPLAHALLGEAREALACLPDAVAPLRTRPVKCWGLERYALPAEAIFRLRGSGTGLGPEERARLTALGREAVGACARFARVFPIGEPRAALVAGTAAWLDGHAARARAAWRRALAAARRLDMPYDEACAGRELERRAGPSEGAGHLDHDAPRLDETGAGDAGQALEQERTG